jgi:hypothetical protein
MMVRLAKKENMNPPRTIGRSARTASPGITTPPSAPAAGIYRVASGLLVLGVLAYAYALRIADGDGNPFNYFGYFTNQTSLLASLVLIVTGARIILSQPVSTTLALLRGAATAYLLVVAGVYNVLVPGTGSAPPWVSVVLHVVVPLAVAVDWLLVGDRARLPWRQLWVLLPYPVLWLAVVLVRGVTDGWVPYGFLLPERGVASLLVHVVGILAAIIAAGVLVWAAGRWRGAYLRAGAD